MADMQAGSAGVRKLNQTVKLRTRVAGNGGVGLFLFPDVLPFFLNGSKIIFHNKTHLFVLIIHSQFSDAPYQGLGRDEGVTASASLHRRSRS